MKKITLLFLIVLLILESSGQSAESFLKIGNQKYNSNELEDAIKNYSRAIDIKPNFFEAYIKRADAKVVLLKMEEAIEDYNIVLKLSPNGYPEVYYKKALVLGLYSGNNETILQLCNYAIKLNPKYTEAHYLRGTTKCYLNDFQGAISDFTETIQMNPSYLDTYLKRGEVKSRLKDYEGAITDFTKAIELNPKNTKSYYYRGIIKAGYLTDNKSAIADFTIAIELDPRFERPALVPMAMLLYP